MPAPTYLSPQYITYAMISTELNNVIKVDLINDPPIAPNNMSVNQVNDYIARGESDIIQTFLANYIQIPLTTTLGGTWDTLLNNPLWYNTYASLKSLFVNSALSLIYRNYFATSGEGNNGANIIKNIEAQINRQSNSLLRVDQAGNPLLKNCFIGLRLCDNFTQRISKGTRIPLIPTGEDQGQMAISSVPNYRWGFNK